MAVALSMVVLDSSMWGRRLGGGGVVDVADGARLCGIGEIVVGSFDAWSQRPFLLVPRNFGPDLKVRLITGCDLDIGYMW